MYFLEQIIYLGQTEGPTVYNAEGLYLVRLKAGLGKSNLVGVYHNKQDALAHAYALVHLSDITWFKHEPVLTEGLNKNFHTLVWYTESKDKPYEWSPSTRTIWVERVPSDCSLYSFKFDKEFWEVSGCA